MPRSLHQVGGIVAHLLISRTRYDTAGQRCGYPLPGSGELADLFFLLWDNSFQHIGIGRLSVNAPGLEFTAKTALFGDAPPINLLGPLGAQLEIAEIYS